MLGEEGEGTEDAGDDGDAVQEGHLGEAHLLTQGAQLAQEVVRLFHNKHLTGAQGRGWNLASARLLGGPLVPANALDVGEEAQALLRIVAEGPLKEEGGCGEVCEAGKGATGARGGGVGGGGRGRAQPRTLSSQEPATRGRRERRSSTRMAPPQVQLPMLSLIACHMLAHLGHHQSSPGINRRHDLSSAIPLTTDPEPT